MRPIVGPPERGERRAYARPAVNIETFAPILFLLIAVPLAAIWINGVLHPLLNHGNLGVAFLVLSVPGLALAYVSLHRCSHGSPQET